jgi:short-subunit dehydrogenase
MKLRNRKFLLLGGTGGIGAGLIDPLLAAGAQIVLASREVSDALKQPPEGVIPVKLDLVSLDLDQQLAALSEAHPDIDGVIHCAGQNRFAAIESLSVEELDRQLAVNLRSPMLIARHFAPRFRASGTGALVFVGSTFGSIGFPGYTAYCATKFGLRGFTEALRRELADTEVQVVYVAPRATATAMNPEAVNEMNRALGNRMDAPSLVAAQIIKAMAGNQRRRFLGWPEKLFVVVNSILPRIVDRAMRKQLPVIRKFLNSEVV